MTAVSQETETVHNAGVSQTALGRVVLDTHIVLDWLWFADPRVDALAQALEAGRLTWLATPDMREELERVLIRLEPKFQKAPNKEQVLTLMDQHATWILQPVPRWRYTCSDPDDQKFIDLALHTQARWLLSRDRAVLKLGPRAHAQGCKFTTPERMDWASG